MTDRIEPALSADEQTYHAELTNAEINSGGFAHIQACWVEDSRVQFASIVHASLLPALQNGMTFTVRGGCIVGGPVPLPPE
jgi:hypothetical protein